MKPTKKNTEITFAQNKKRHHKLFSPLAFFFCVISGAREDGGEKNKRWCLDFIFVKQLISTKNYK